jgi:hypothetical protein
MANMDRPLLIVTFQGVLGDFQKGGVKDVKAARKFEKAKSCGVDQSEVQQLYWNNLNLRSDTLEGLVYLANCFQIVVFSRESVEDSWGLDRGTDDFG